MNSLLFTHLHRLGSRSKNGQKPKAKRNYHFGGVECQKRMKNGQVMPIQRWKRIFNLGIQFFYSPKSKTTFFDFELKFFLET